jgi:hypothetical protein
MSAARPPRSIRVGTIQPCLRERSPAILPAGLRPSGHDRLRGDRCGPRAHVPQQIAPSPGPSPAPQGRGDSAAAPARVPAVGTGGGPAVRGGGLRPLLPRLQSPGTAQARSTVTTVPAPMARVRASPVVLRGSASSAAPRGSVRPCQLQCAARCISSSEAHTEPRDTARGSSALRSRSLARETAALPGRITRIGMPAKMASRMRLRDPSQRWTAAVSPLRGRACPRAAGVAGTPGAG